MHRQSRPHRSLTAFLAVLALLFSQLALAAYACPGAVHAGATQDGAASASAMAERMAERMAAGEPCDRGASADGSEQPALCHQHCADAPQSADTAQPTLPTLPALAPAWPAPPRPVLLASGAPPPAHRVAEVALRPPPNPLFLSTLRLRV